MSFYSIRKKELADIADAIRAKTGKSDGMSIEDMPKEIKEIKDNDNIDNFSSSILKFDYNGNILPLLPVETEYPYCFICKSASQFSLCFSSSKYYHVDAEGEHPNRIITASSSSLRNYLIKLSDKESATEWAYRNNTRYYYSTDSSDIIWANFDIPKGAVSATEIWQRKSNAPKPFREQ